MQLYSNQSSDPKTNAQKNLMGRTHYVDPDTLRYHKSRIVSARHTHGGLMFAIVESCALDMKNTKRGFRYSIFDLFGHVIDRPDLENTSTTSRAAEKAMWASLNSLNAQAITLAAIRRKRDSDAQELTDLAAKVRGIKQ